MGTYLKKAGKWLLFFTPLLLGGVGLIGLEGEPVAFALGETLGGCACYSFQKNRENFRGLTFYLSYHCAMLPGHPPLLNWCEDMGLEGLRINKLRYRPSAIVSKYTVTLQS